MPFLIIILLYFCKKLLKPILYALKSTVVNVKSRIIFIFVIVDSICHRNISIDSLSPENQNLKKKSHIHPHVTLHTTHILS
jgi:hypothetical protein